MGLVNYGLFSEKLPPCFTSEGLSDHIPNILLTLRTENDPKKMTLSKQLDQERYAMCPSRSDYSNTFRAVRVGFIENFTNRDL